MYYAISLLFIYFILYAIIGWFCEVVYCSIIEKKFVNRGFLNGPYCPIYGVGALFIVTLLTPFVINPPIIFLLGVILTSLLEYITSWGMEKLFHAKWWDYSKHRFNINGRVCLLNSFFFGIMALTLMYLVHPFVQRIIGPFSSFWIQIIATVAAVIFISDVVESTRETLVFNKKLSSIYEMTTELKDSLKEKGIHTVHELTTKVREFKEGKFAGAMDSAQNLVIHLSNRISETKKINRYSHRRIINAFPSMSHRDHQNSLEIYKAFLLKSKAKKNPEVNSDQNQE